MQYTAPQDLMHETHLTMPPDGIAEDSSSFTAGEKLSAMMAISPC